MKKMILATVLFLGTFAQAAKITNVKYDAAGLPTIEMTGSFFDYRLNADGKFEFYSQPGPNLIGKATLTYTADGLNLQIQGPTEAKCTFVVGNIRKIEEVGSTPFNKSVQADFELSSSSTCAHNAQPSPWDVVQLSYVISKIGPNITISTINVSLITYGGKQGIVRGVMPIFQ